MFNEFKRPMWNDGWSTIRPWTNLYSDYELTHCCFGDNGDSDDGGGGLGVDDDPGRSMTANEAEAAAAAGAAAAAAAAAEGASAAEQAAAEQDAIDDFTDMAAAADVDAEFTEAGPTTTQTTADQAQEAFDAVGDLSNYSTTDAAQAATDIATASVTGSTADLSGFDTSSVEEAIDQLNEIGEVSIGYNDLAGFTDEKGFGLSFGPEESYFDRKEDDIQRADQAIAAAIEKNAKDKGRDVEVSVDPQGQFSYTPGPTGSLADVAAVAGSQMAQGFADIAPMASPTGIAASLANPDLFDLGLDLAPRDLAATATQGVLSDRQGTFDRGAGAGPATLSFDEAVAQGVVSVGQPESIQTQIDAFDRQTAFEDLLGAVVQGVGSVDPVSVTNISEPARQALADEIAAEQAQRAAQALSAEAAIEKQNRDAMERQDRAREQAEIDQGVVSPGATTTPGDVITDPFEEQMVADAARTAAEGAVGLGSDIQFAQFDDSLLAEDVDLLGDLLGDEDQGGDNVVVEAKPKPDPDPEPPVEDTPPRPFEILPFAASTPFTPRTQYGQIVPVTRTQFARPGGIANLQRQLAILNRRLFT